MYSTRCTNCRQLINLKTDELREAIEQAEANRSKIYTMNCPKCRKQVKLQVSQLKLKLPRPVELPTQQENGEAAQTSDEESAAQ